MSDGCQRWNRSVHSIRAQLFRLAVHVFSFQLFIFCVHRGGEGLFDDIVSFQFKNLTDDNQLECYRPFKPPPKSEHKVATLHVFVLIYILPLQQLQHLVVNCETNDLPSPAGQRIFLRAGRHLRLRVQLWWLSVRRYWHATSSDLASTVRWHLRTLSCPVGQHQ